MTSDALMLLGGFLVALLALSYPLGLYMARVMQGDTPRAMRVLAPLEHGFYRLAGVDARQEMGWKGYSIGLIIFSLIGVWLLRRATAV